MTIIDDSDTGELLSLLDRLNVRDSEDSPTAPPPPRTPSPPSHHPISPGRRAFPNHTFPSVRTRNIPSPSLRPIVPHFSPRSAVYRAETEPLVSGVPSCIFRGYRTVIEAQAAFEYARERHWVRVAGDPITMGIPALPQPSLSETNPLNGTETVDGLWYIVYRGIFPGVYRSHLECQLNTLGVRGALHESVVGPELALHKYTQANLRPSEVAVVTPPYRNHNSDPFL
ncbi:hypothetical protein C8R43DRAFT_1118685 [Mycena crocata]|nr:hypothetical protein C8R43DRAFT_1118685 [Mycena crocata]